MKEKTLNDVMDRAQPVPDDIERDDGVWLLRYIDREGGMNVGFYRTLPSDKEYRDVVEVFLNTYPNVTDTDDCTFQFDHVVPIEKGQPDTREEKMDDASTHAECPECGEDVIVQEDNVSVEWAARSIEPLHEDRRDCNA
mgnify:CR=1 FL=1